MRFAYVLFVAATGCSSENKIDVGNYSADTGADIVLTEDANASCVPIFWSYGPDRFCEECVCAGTPCRTHAIGESLFSGVCDEKLKCSAECHDPLWDETHDAGADQ